MAHYNGYHAGPSVAPIPAPTPKVAYDAPVFKTFQERKRARELAARIESPSSQQSFTPPAQHHIQQPYHSPSLKNYAPPVSHSAQSPSIPSLPPIIVGSRVNSATLQNGRPLPSPRPLPFQPQSPVEATLERSDTLASIRSLDRSGFSSSSTRPLPKPPTSVATSRSLDRGVPTPTKRTTINTNGDEPRSPARYSPLPSIRSQSPSTPTAPSPIIPSININTSPGIPTINFPDEPSPPSPSIAISPPSSIAPDIVVGGTPTIAVTSDSSSPITRVEIDGGAILCGGCNNPIIGRILNAMNKRFHPDCFRCEECKEHLEHVSSYEWEGRAYCHLDYHDKFAHHCFHCKTPIVDPRFVTLHDDTLGEQRYYHELHFFCSECGDPFLDPSKAGASSNEEETNAFTIHKGHPYCENCHLRLHKPKCRGCKGPIPDVAVNAMGAKWHKHCFVCDMCEIPLSNLFFPSEGKAFCTACFEQHRQ